ncbi:hypothetical protein C4565_00925 [Candidatus Parcubacteria bacterium]|jgi:hypothetical protein|nr:MAG: hypothetical protein C4565_00925 [Candidatus Parcubacteria bacterium]
MRNKKILSVGIVMIGIAYSAYLLFYTTDKNLSSAQITGSEKNDSQFLKNDRKSIYSLNEPNFNATEQTIKDYELAIFEYNKNKKGGDEILLPNEVDIQNIIQKYTTQPILSQIYTKKDITIEKKSTLTDLISYIEKIEKKDVEIERKRETNIVSAVGIFVLEKKSDDLQKHINAESEYIDFLLETPAFSGWEDFHLAILNNAEKRRTLAKIIIENPDDPVKVIAVVENLSTLIKNDDIVWNVAISSLQ